MLKSLGTIVLDANSLFFMSSKYRFQKSNEVYPSIHKFKEPESIEQTKGFPVYMLPNQKFKNK